METESVQLRDQVAVLRRRWKAIAGVVLLAVVLSLLLSWRQSPTYDADATVVLAEGSFNAGQETSPLTPEQISAEVEEMTSYAVAQRVVDSLNLDESPDDALDSITVTPDANGAAFVTIAAARGSAQEAADVANAFADSYVADGQAEAEQRLAVMARTTNSLNRRISRISGQLESVTDTAERTQLASERTSLQAQRTLIVRERANLLLGLAAPDFIGEVTRPAEPPTAASSPKVLRSAILAGLIGLIVGIAVAFFRDYFDDVIRDESILRKTAGDRPILGRIPRSRDIRSGGVAALVAPRTPVGEAFRGLGANVRSRLTPGQWPASAGSTCEVLLVGSPRAGEGRTSTAANLAVVSARSGLRVVLIDGDLRNPRIADALSLKSAPGLSDVVAGNDPVGGYLSDAGVSGLRVLTAGTPSANPAEVLASPALKSLLVELAVTSDLIIIDSAPLLAVADALELVNAADQLLLVVREGVTKKQDLTTAVQRVQQLGGDVAGIVLNDVSPRTADYKDGYAQYAASVAPVAKQRSGSSVSSPPS